MLSGFVIAGIIVAVGASLPYWVRTAVRLATLVFFVIPGLIVMWYLGVLPMIWNGLVIAPLELVWWFIKTFVEIFLTIIGVTPPDAVVVDPAVVPDSVIIEKNCRWDPESCKAK